MACLNYGSLNRAQKSEKDMTYEYWYEFLYPRLLDSELEVDMEILDKNYEFYKTCQNFIGNIDELTFYLEGLGYRNFIFVNEINLQNFLKNNANGIKNGVYNFAFKDGIFILAIKCNPTKIFQIRENFKLMLDKIGFC